MTKSQFRVAGSALAAAAAIVAGAPAEAQSYNWTGFYLGTNLGGAWSATDATTNVASNGAYFITTDPAQIASAGVHRQSARGFSGGAQTGYNWQTGPLVLGVEADFNVMRLRTSRSATVGYTTAPGTGFTVGSATDNDWLFTLRPRIGYAAGGWLIYATGGLAVSQGHNNFWFLDTYGSGARESASASNRVGWTVGGGLEVMLTRNWTVKGEYLFGDFGKVSAGGVVTNTGSIPPAALAHQADLTKQIVRFGINYKF
jgi:outer membrane immunogenic protein